MGAAARQRMLEKFTWPQVVRRCLEFLSETIVARDLAAETMGVTPFFCGDCATLCELARCQVRSGQPSRIPLRPPPPFLIIDERRDSLHGAMITGEYPPQRGRCE